MWSDFPILTPGEIKHSGWYWWRPGSLSAWRIEYFDMLNRPHQKNIMGGEFIGPIPRPAT